MDDTREQSILALLDVALQRASVRAQIEATVARVEQSLLEQPDALMAWELIPLSAYLGALPPEIRSRWVFILRAGATTVDLIRFIRRQGVPHNDQRTGAGRQR